MPLVVPQIAHLFQSSEPNQSNQSKPKIIIKTKIDDLKLDKSIIKVKVPIIHEKDYYFTSGL